MTDTPARDSAPASGAENEARPTGDAGTAANTGAPSASDPADMLARETAEIEALAQEAADMKDRLLRALADMENLRRRTEREVADARAYGISAFARDLLGVADNMRRALDAAERELQGSVDPKIKAVVEGVELTERELLKVLEKHGVRKFEPLGEKFDPNLHQAMFEVPDAASPSGTVVQLIQAGYKIGDRVLRPAMVGVSRGGPKPGAAPTGAATENPENVPEPQGSGDAHTPR